MRKRKRLPQIISQRELSKILHYVLSPKNRKRKFTKGGKFERIRNCMIFILMYYLGLRPKESMAIKISHIDFNSQQLFIPAENNKQRHADKLPIPNFIFDKILQYISKTKKDGYYSEEWLFPSNHWRTRDGRPLRGTITRCFKKALQDSKLLHLSYTDDQGKPRYNITLYSLRHSFGTRVLQVTKSYKKTAMALRQRDDQYRSVFVYDHTTDYLDRSDIFKEVYFTEKEKRQPPI
ncbi:MAG: site-specific integrase [Nanoarchaeota archaeon]|nr:site-specific integrase [Nanoarchaeota archaeon]